MKQLRSVLLVLVSVFSVAALGLDENEALKILETRLRETTPAPKGIFSARDDARTALRKVQAVNAAAENSPATVCKVSRTAVLGTRYTLSMDEQGARPAASPICRSRPWSARATKSPSCRRKR